MRYQILESGIIRGGFLEINLNPVDDIYDCHYSAEVELGKKIFGKWISLPSFSKDGSLRISRDELSEQTIKNHFDMFTIKDIAFQRTGEGSYSFKGNDFDGNIILRFDGLDPVEITYIEVNWNGYLIKAQS